jgi:branched-chain amino acid transport system substrate-binding protein
MRVVNMAHGSLYLLGYGCADDTADKAIEETRRLVEQEVRTSSSGRSRATKGSRSPTTRRTIPTLKVQAPNFFR